MNHVNWVDPDIFEDRNGDIPENELTNERAFKEFFDTGWRDERFAHLHQLWSVLLSDESSHARLMAKVAIWSIKSHIELKDQLLLLAKTQSES